MAPRDVLLPMVMSMLIGCQPVHTATPTRQSATTDARSITVGVTPAGFQTVGNEAARLARLRGKLADMERVAELQTKSPDGQGLTGDERAEEQRILTSWPEKYGEPWDNNDLPGRIATLKQQLARGASAIR